MSMNDPLGDLLTRIRNAQMRSKNKVSSPLSLRASARTVGSTAASCTVISRCLPSLAM